MKKWIFLLLLAGVLSCEEPSRVVEVRRGVEVANITWGKGPGVDWLSGLSGLLISPDSCAADFVFDPQGVALGSCQEPCAANTLACLHRRALQELDGGAMDRVERILFNELVAVGVSASNPDARSLMAFQHEDTLWINQFLPATISGIGPNQGWQVEVETDYPLSGNIKIRVTGKKAAVWTLAFRQPGWTDNQPDPDPAIRYRWRSNTKLVAEVKGEFLYPALAKGYAYLTRSWRPGEVLEITLPMSIRRLLVDLDGETMVSLERGPMVLVNTNDPEGLESLPDRGYLMEKLDSKGRPYWEWEVQQQPLEFVMKPHVAAGIPARDRWRLSP